MLPKKKSVPYYFKNTWTDRRNHSNIGQDLFHKPSVCTMSPIANASQSYAHSCSYVLTWKEVRLQSLPIPPPFNGF